MTSVSLTVNGRAVSAEVAPRTHLADFLRETVLLTGTHLGCEQGVCGACTVMLDGQPARACLTFAALCDGMEVRTVEGLSDDPLGEALRQAFSAEHALQCGYCTPGMLVTARDIVCRLPKADPDRIRLELAGNLCRCTGYNGIIRAIQRVIESGAFAAAGEVAAPLPVGIMHDPLPDVAAEMEAVPPTRDGTTLAQRQAVPLPADAVWAAIRDPALIAACIPGARITSVTDNRIEGEMTASLGPIHARFSGKATVYYDDATRTGHITGHGRDKLTRLAAEAHFAVTPDGASATTVGIDIQYALTGPLAQFSRGPVVAVFARELATTVARNLTARLQGHAVRTSGNAGSMLRLVWRTLWHWVSGRRG